MPVKRFGEPSPFSGNPIDQVRHVLPKRHGGGGFEGITYAVDKVDHALFELVAGDIHIDDDDEYHKVVAVKLGVMNDKEKEQFLRLSQDENVRAKILKMLGWD